MSGASVDPNPPPSPMLGTAGPASPASHPGFGGGKGLTHAQKQLVFMALTFIVIVIVAMMCPDVFTALAIITLLVGFAAAFVAAGRVHDHGQHAAHEGFDGTDSNLPGAPPPYAINTPPPSGDGPTLAEPGVYPGAIDGVDDHDSEAGYGHLDRNVGENAEMPYGNIFNRNRVSTPQAAAACLDDEANDAEMDADELMTFQGRGRNDAERVTAGTMNRRKFLQPYLESEVDEAQNREWWGRSEY